MKKKQVLWLLGIIFILTGIVYTIEALQKKNTSPSTPDTVPIASTKAPPAGPIDSTIDTVPIAAIAKDRFVFDDVLENTVITHTFILENRGKAVLNIEKVVTGCGCTAVDHPDQIQPGSEGGIIVSADTKGYGGRQFSKTVLVVSNDPKHGQLKLYISGKVDRLAEITPPYVSLAGGLWDTVQAAVTIIPTEKYPFEILDSSMEKDLIDKIAIDLEKKADHYILHVKNLLKHAGRYTGKIHLKTDHPQNADIAIEVVGHIEDVKSEHGTDVE